MQLNTDINVPVQVMGKYSAESIETGFETTKMNVINLIIECYSIVVQENKFI